MNKLNHRPKKYAANIQERWCYNCSKYHPTTLKHWLPNPEQPKGLGTTCVYPRRIRKPKLKIGEMPKVHKAIVEYLSKL